MKRRIAEDPPTNMKLLKEAIIKLWTTQMNDIQYLKNLSDSMPRRIQDVISQERSTTKYYLFLYHVLIYVINNKNIF